MSGQTVFENLLDSGIRSIDEKQSFIKTDQSQRKNIFRTLVTREEVDNIIKSAISDAELVDYYLRPYSEEKLGFLASHQSLIVSFKRPGSSNKEKHSFFVKAIPYDVPSQASYVEEKGCFRKEADFFKHLVPLMTRNYIKGDPWAPRCFLAKDNILVFEDMMFRGYSNGNKMFDHETMKSAVACIARFHASSLLAEETLEGKSLLDLYPELLEESEFKRTGRSYVWYATAVDLAISVAKDLGLDASRVRQASERVFDICRPSSNKRNVVSHGDLWSGNLLFAGADRCNLIDFQLVRYAPLAHDVMQLLYLATTRAYRQKHERWIVRYYHEILQETLNDNGYRGVVPPFQEVLLGAEEQRLPAIVTAIIFHPTVLMDGRTAAKIMNDPVTYEAYYFKERKPFVEEIMAENPEYERRIKEGVAELVEMSMILDELPRCT